MTASKTELFEDFSQEIEHIEFGDYIDNTVIVYVKSIYRSNTVPIEVKLPIDFMTSNKKYNIAKRIYNAWKKNKRVFESNVIRGAL